MNSLISIIIPTYNRANLIIDTLDSVLSQTYTNWECIIIDDGSTDNTLKILNKYCKKDLRFQYHKRPYSKHKGANACRNYGFELSKGEYINWLDDDDIILPDFLKTKLLTFNSELDIVMCSGYYVDEKLQNRRTIELKGSDNIFKDYALWKAPVLTPSLLIKKSFLKDKDLFGDKIKRGQETELFSRLFYKLSKKSYQIISTPLFLYRQHNQTKSFKNKEYNKAYKNSQSFIAVENLKKSIKLKDLDLIHHYYKLLLGLFFRGIENNNLNNSKYILKNLISHLNKNNKRLSLELFFFGYIFLILGKGSYRIEKRFRTFKIV